MLERGAREYGADLTRSYTVGDRIVDIQAGQAAGTTTILVLSGYGRETVRECAEAGVRPDVTVRDLAEAAEVILQQLDRGERAGPGRPAATHKIR
jgi:D-glycero-D-manno-heptose 1,7-bisphosphate phosphatase